MAGGKQTPRQKMINLMYLIFIAMLALNMSKEVLAAFGLMNEKLETSNTSMDSNNASFFASLETKASENEEEYGELYADAQKVKELSDDYYSYLEGLKKEMTADLEDPKDYVVMDKSDYLDQKFFQGDNLGPEGKKFMEYIDNYRDGVINALPEGKFESLKAAVKARFATGDADGKVEKRDGTRQDWINYHYEGFPLVASLTKMTQLQADIKTTEQEVLKTLLEGELTEAVSLTNFASSLAAPKTAYYAGEKYDGKVIVSKTDKTSTPVKAELTLDGRALTEGKDYELEAGGIKMLISAGTPGDHTIKGTMTFMQDGNEVPVEVNNTFATISMPNAAVISADKMNVVYRGVANPMTISIPGIPDNKVSASAAGLSRRSGSQYIMNPGTGRTVTITASGTLPDGKGISTKSEFRIKDIPRPAGTVRGESGSVKMPKNNLEISTVSAMLEDFDFDLNLAVSQFKVKVPGQPTVVVNGNKMDARAKSALRRAGRGDAIQIFDIQAYITNNKSYKLKKVSPVVVELTN
ncbi:type IX secretion system motor protein PorM/GldM [Flagellimonas zhangzhouensis]|uniref:Protein involved in gliding motility GldM n=1 Tax=Flagellimonas zhangzhouensis TaxID=1073328 RepID=A0A1H2VSY6_9FLAO|nr:gliding motility protein GldM [Allomuricauda zhangzhouensis]SDQ05870.1 protein involved in gliding motility GldM [Allomuricauda zhangzhouensis]SDW71381.1 protein involved in gliding motility GldM [Allomuricauda zhangzhouensis]